MRDPDQSRARVRTVPGMRRTAAGLAPWGYRPATAGRRPCGFGRWVRRCGTRCGLRDGRERGLYVASLGLSVVGVDVAETALAMARAKAEGRGIDVAFEAGDALRLERLGRRFQTVLDCGLFHSLEEDDDVSDLLRGLVRPDRASGNGLRPVLQRPGTPRPAPTRSARTSRRLAFTQGHGWQVAALEADRLQTTFHHDGAPAWLATLTRI